MKLWMALAASLSVAVTLSSAWAETSVHEKTIGAYRIRIIGDPDSDAPDAYRLEIRRGQRLVLKQNAGRVSRLDFPEWAPPDGADLTGRGQPDLVVEHFTGGAHCCTTALIYELGSKPKLMAKIDVRDGEGVEFQHLPDLGWIARLADWTFNYWNAPFTGSPYVPIAMAYRAGAFHLVAKLMRTPPWSDTLIDQAVKIIQSDFEFEAKREHDPPPSLWAVMLSLVYSGHLAQARKLLDRAWPSADGEVWKYELGRDAYPASPEGRQKFWDDFLGQLAHSPYWIDLHAMNGLPPLPGRLDRMPQLAAFWLRLSDKYP